MLITKALLGLSASAVRASAIAASHSLPHIRHVRQDGVRHRVLVVERDGEERLVTRGSLNLLERAVGEVPNVPLQG